MKNSFSLSGFLSKSHASLWVIPVFVAAMSLSNVACAADEAEQVSGQPQVVEEVQADIPKSMQRKARRKNNAGVLFQDIKKDEESLEEKLSPESTALFESITADGMPDVIRSVKVKNSVKIEKGDSNDPFPPAQPDNKIVAGDKGLEISIRERDTTDSEYLRSAQDALKAGQMESAVAYYKKVLSRDEGNEKAKFGLATTYHHSGQLDQARDMYIDLITMSNDNWPALNNFFILASEEAPDDAIRQLKRLQESNPEFAGIPAQIGMIYIKQNNLEEAVKNLGKAVSLDPENLRYQYDLATLLDIMGYKEMAGKLYQSLLIAGREGKDLPASYMQIQERFALMTALAK